MRFVLGKVSIALTLIMLVGANGHARELTLDDCIELALKNRASIIAARGLEDLARANQRSALGAFLPRVNASYGYSKGKETNIDPMRFVGYTGVDSAIVTHVVGSDSAVDLLVTPTGAVLYDEQDMGPSKSLRLSGEMSVFNLFNWFNYAQARAERASARLNVIDSEQDLIYAVKIAYYAYLAAVENVEVQKQAVERSEEQLKLIRSRYELGSASLSDVLKQKVQYGNDKLTLLKGRNAVVTSKAGLSYTVGVDPKSDVEFSTIYRTREFQGTMDEAIAFGLEHEPGLLSAQRSLDAARHGVRSGLAGYLPQLSAYASYTRFNGTQAFPEVFNYSSNTLTYGFSINLNIFDGFWRERQVSAAKIDRNNAMAQLSDTRNLMTREIKTAYFNIEQQKEAKSVAGENVDAATEDLKITQEKYNLGAATILDLLDAQVSLKQAQVALIQADFDLNLAVAQLENATGKM